MNRTLNKYVFSPNDDWENQTILDNTLKESILAVQEKWMSNKYTRGIIRGQSSALASSFPYSAGGANHLDSAKMQTKNAEHMKFSKEGKDGYNLKIENTHQFMEWFEKLEAEVALEQDIEIQQMKREIERKKVVCEQILEVSKDVSSLLDNIQTTFDTAKLKEEEFEVLIKDQKEEQEKNITLQKDLKECLDFYSVLDEVTRLLNSPGNQACENPRLFSYLQKIDQSIDFIRANRYARDAELYLLRFQQSQVRALTLIKLYFSQKLKDVVKQKTQNSPSEDILFSRFKSCALEMRPFIQELEIRLGRTPEAAGLLVSMYKSYFSIRKQLILGSISEKLSSIKASAEQNVNLSIEKKYLDNLPDDNNSEADSESLFQMKSSIQKKLQLENILGDKLQLPKQESISVEASLNQASILFKWYEFVCSMCTEEYMVLSLFFNLTSAYNFSSAKNLTEISNNELKSPIKSPKKIGESGSFSSFAVSVLPESSADVFYTQVTSEASLFLESFLSILYDISRPLIISEHSIQVLSIYCTILQSFGWTSSAYSSKSDPSVIFKDASNIIQADDDNGFYSENENQKDQGNGGLDLSLDFFMSTFHSTVENLHRDCLHRLTFRAQGLIDANIRNYTIGEQSYSDIQGIFIL
ncbi:hypothetical protein BB558_004212 [Smittium angustum]|uniref:Conserved oligomeric Golgi complex subunit 3 n=1 Tax=Smittium angustum TaxID=133377 RepID=A0A2U1J3U5_SMIAN|nr:hypothetical protein BB558_006232 [Smittium angustum]PVZ98824.1 hypothetical protein BB558_005175 [Smittium angustum]PVZ99751.1 hypothetical protein BB558_004212 [Smittium angustum]